MMPVRNSFLCVEDDDTDRKEGFDIDSAATNVSGPGFKYRGLLLVMCMGRVVWFGGHEEEDSLDSWQGKSVVSSAWLLKEELWKGGNVSGSWRKRSWLC